ncbi:MAG: vitamin K epoxide reductase [bacterium]|nr:MAG: vitamin K epoxide reductase [bacterium]
MESNHRYIPLIFYFLAAAGVVVSITTLLESASPAVQSLCGGPAAGCSQVQASAYSKILGIPLGVWGVVSCIAWIVLFRIRRAWAGIFGALLLGAEFHFLYLQLYVIMAVCVLCMAQFALVAMLNALLFFTAYPASSRRWWRLASLPVLIASFLVFYVPMDGEAAKTAAAGAESMTSWGNPSSPVRIELFSDYQCSYCGKFEVTLKEIMKRYPDVHIVFRDYIIPSHEMSPSAVVYAGSVAYYEGREAYLKTRFELFDNQKRIYDYLKTRYAAIKDDPKMREAVKAKVVRDHELAKSFGVSGTPTTVIRKDGEVVKVYRGHKPFAKIQKDLDAIIGGK